LNLILAISYSARWEITEAMRNIAAKAAKGELNPNDITDEVVANNLTTAGIPDPDLLIRTGGDLRISNFLLWQIAYSEIYVTQKYWPDFSNDDYIEAINSYASRQRRFGMTGDQIDDINSSSK
jgi:undecaprenyl diphosphate synthase